MPERREPAKTLVRGPDGVLYLLSKDGEPKKLSPEQSEQVVKIIEDNEIKLASDIEKAIPAMGHGVHVGIGVHCGTPEV